MHRVGIWVFSLLLLLVAAPTVAGTPFTLRGEFVQGGLVFGEAPPGSTVTQDGRPVRVGTSGEFLLGFDRDAPAESEVEVILPDGSRHPVRLEVAAREYEIQRIDGLPPAKVTPRRPEDLERIRRDVAMVKAARTRDDDRPDFQAGFEWPARGRISGVYGSQRILNGEPRRPHYGVDVAAPTGTPVTAPAPGIVTLADPDLFFSGGTLILDHGHQLSSSFLHLHRLHVAVGERVEQGQLIGEIGATGRVTGPHLDWRMNLRDRRVDPTLLVPPMSSEATAARP
jgi:murein DD-endopeptidase MepM/ murein hydrolase activator NlpD